MSILDALIDSIKVDAAVRQVQIGAFWTAVLADRCGLASTPPASGASHLQPPVPEAGRLAARSALDLARRAATGSPLEAAVGVAAGYDVKKSDILGLSVRGGGVIGHVRWGDRVYSPIVPEGRVDYLIAFEKLEGLRWADQIKPTGTVLINQQKILPVIVSSGLAKYPQDDVMDAAIHRIAPVYHKVPALDMALKLGNSKVVNVVLLGVLSSLLDVDPVVWESVLKERVPSKHFEVNKKAFYTGRDWMKGTLG